jgi:DNA-binding CsgD family transcriptional regulator
MLQGGFTEVLTSRDREEFRDQLVVFTKRLGFDTVSATLVIDHALGAAEFVSVDNTPDEFRSVWADAQRNRQDPVLQHCKHKSVPIVWDQSTYVRNGLGHRWEEQAPYGFRTGISLALHMPEGKHFLIGVDRDQPMPQSSAELTRMVADLQLFAVHAQEAASRVLLAAVSDQPNLPSLTPRELEALRWTMEGMTAWEVGNHLSITERTAVMHLANATHKLGANNKHQAVLKALRLGLLR